MSSIKNTETFIKLFNVGFINRRQSVNDIFHIFTEYAIINASNDLKAKWKCSDYN